MNIQDIQKDIEKSRQGRSKIKVELEQVQSREAAILKQAGDDLIEGRDNGAEQELTKVRARREFLAEALAQVERKIAASETELFSLQNALLTKPWTDFEKTIWQRFEQVQATIGEQGLNGEIEKIRVEFHEARKAYPATVIGGGPELADMVQFTLTAITRGLYEVWKTIEVLEGRNPNRKPRPVSAQPDVIPGFGKMP